MFNVIWQISLKVVDHLASIWGPVKMKAAKCLSSYQLGLGQSWKKHVESLLQDLQFHIPGIWGGHNGNVSIWLAQAQDCLTVFDQEWVPESKGAFKHPAIADTIKAAFFTSSCSIGYQYVDKFTSSVAHMPNEREVPISLLALALIGVSSFLMLFTGLYSC